MPESATVAVPVGRGASDQGRVASRPGRSGRAAVERGWPLRLGVLTAQIDPALVDEVVAAAGVLQRRARLLPARAVVYFVLGLCLFSGADAAAPPGYRSVARSLTNGLRHLPHPLTIPSSAALSRARQRLGAEPLRLLFERLRGPRARPGTAGAFAFGRRLVAWDSTGIDVPDSRANAAVFGRAGGAGHPQLRLLTLLECGTHALLGAVFDGFDRASEPALAAGCSTGWNRACCWPTATSPAMSCGHWPRPPARTWPGGSSGTTSSCRCAGSRAARTCR